MEQTSPLVPRNTYNQAVLEAMAATPYDPELHNGLNNPYSHKKVICEEDYYEYLREYVYYRLCDKLLEQQYDFQLEILDELLETQYEAKAEHFNQKHGNKTSGANRWWFIVSIILSLLLAYMVFWYVPTKGSNEYSSGYEQGYGRGYADALLTDSGSYGRNFSTDVALSRADLAFNRTVYISSNGKIHLNPHCSGMQSYSKMRYGDACIAGYDHCLNCF